MNGFYITVKNGLLEPKHFKAMGGDRNIGTVWLFLWLLDKMTIIDHEKGEGKVLGGKPIKFEEIQADLGISLATYKRWLNMLRENGYIETTRTPYGLTITVFKAFKVFGQKSDRKLSGEPSENGDSRLVSHLSQADGEPSNKTRQLDNTIRKKNIIKRKQFSTLEEINPEVVEEIANKYRVPVSFVETQLDKMVNWLEAKGKTYKNYKAGLRNWVVNDPNYSKSKIQVIKPTPEYTQTPEQRKKARERIEKIRKEKFGESQVA